MSGLADRIESGTLAEVAALLDGLSPADREAALSGLGRKLQRQLYQKAADGPILTTAHFVPEGREQVHHFGRNTLPLPGKHRFFEKRFCPADPLDGRARLFGYNEAPSKGLIGPGFFVAYATAGRPDWEARGSVVIDYFLTPDGPVPGGWPAVVPNTKGLQRFVYNGTRDFMRGVSAHVTIGAAHKGEKALDHYFVLCRRDS